MDIETQQALEHTWLQHCQYLGADNNIAVKWKDDLLKKYSGPGRFYHTLNLNNAVGS